MPSYLGLGLGLLLLAGCAVGPDYHAPRMAVPAQWSGQSASEAKDVPSDQELGHWWEIFHDPLLNSLEERALATNLDLKLAAARIQEARALRLGAGANLGPTVEGTSQYRHSRVLAADGSTASTANQFEAGFDAAWELDLFGGGRRGVEAADADLLAAAEASHSAMVSLSAEVASTYLGLRAQQQAVETARRNLTAEEETAALSRELCAAGFRSSLDLAGAEAQVANRRALIPPLEATVQQSIHSLGILLGREPAALNAELTPVAALPAGPPAVPAGLPADLLRRRPDIRRAEALIHSATARIGVAEADLFPKLTLSGLVNLSGGALDSWFNWSNRLWSLGPSASWQLFDSGRIKARVMQQESLEQQSLITYQQTVLSALQEVEDALVVAGKEAEHLAALEQAQVANQKALELATTLYGAGQTDFLSVLQAEQAVYATDDALIQSKKTLATNLVALYKALGGGWQTAAR